MDVLSAAPVTAPQRLPKDAQKTEKVKGETQSKDAFDQEMLVVNGMSLAQTADLIEGVQPNPEVQNGAVADGEAQDLESKNLQQLLQSFRSEAASRSAEGPTLDQKMVEMGVEVESIQVDGGREDKSSPNQMSSEDFLQLVRDGEKKSLSAKAVQQVEHRSGIPKKAQKILPAITSDEAVRRSFGEIQGFDSRSKGRIERMDAQTLSIVNSNHARPGSTPTEMISRPSVEVTGHVVQGAMATDRLSSESLFGISKNLQSMQELGGGEIKLRLKPDSLGELRLTVTTVGNEVGIKVQTSNPAAKVILEESIGHLKDTLLKQNLSLGKIDFLTNPILAAGDSQSADLQSQMQQNQDNAGQLFERYREQFEEGQDERQGWGRSGAEEPEIVPLARGRAAQAGRGAKMGEGRLDIRA